MSERKSSKQKEIGYDEFKIPESSDPKVQITVTGLKLTPFYFNWTFTTNFLPIVASLVILIKQDDPKVNFFCWLFISVCLIMILAELRYYNTVVLDSRKQTLVVNRNIIRKMINKNTVVQFKDIERIDFYSTLTRPSLIRYVIQLHFNNGSKIKLISTNDRNRASELSGLLSSYIRK